MYNMENKTWHQKHKEKMNFGDYFSDYGFDINMGMNNRDVEDYTVVDEQKFMWFVLRYS